MIDIQKMKQAALAEQKLGFDWMAVSFPEVFELIERLETAEKHLPLGEVNAQNSNKL